MNNIQNNNRNSNAVQETIFFDKLRHEDEGRWDVTVPKPTPIFPLERGTKLINESISIVSKRIDECLRKNSIQATFDVHNVEATCKTAAGLQYKIFLYAGPENENGSTTYVEIIKMKGCGFQFTKEKEIIINAAKDLQPNPDKSRNVTMKIPSDLLKLYVPPSIHELESTLDRISEQLHSRNRKILLFALQNLASMTTPDKCYPQNAHQMSCLVMRSRSDVRDIIVSIYTATHDMIDENTENIVSSCLHILQNVTQSFYSDHNDTNSKKSLAQQGGEDTKYFIDQLVPSLLTAVTNCKDTHNACLALTILCNLIKHSPETCVILRERNAIAVIEEAQLYGSIEHLKLETEARRTIEALQSQP